MLKTTYSFISKQQHLRILLTLLVISLLLPAHDAFADTNAVNFDNTSSSIVYTGSWAEYATPNAIYGSQHRSNQYGSEASLGFYGSTITYFYSMAYNRGSQEVFIDGQSQGTFSSYTAEIRRQVGKTWSFNYGWHQIRVRALGGNYIDLDMFSVDIPSVGTGVYDNTNAQFRWFGTWSDSTYVVGTYNNTNRISNVGESGFRFTFVGDEITYLYTMTNNRGKAAITIDGVNKGIIDQYSSDLRRQIGVTYSGLGSGVHILNVVNTGSKNASSIDYYIDVDAVVVGNVYNRDAAWNYAHTWAHGRNPNYPNFDTIFNCNDCTNFVSQVLEAGGIPQIQNGSLNTAYYWYAFPLPGVPAFASSYTWRVTSHDASVPPPITPSIKEHADLFTWRYQSTSTVLNLSKGDFFLVDTAVNNHAGADHANVVYGWGYTQEPTTEPSELNQYRFLRAAHCNDRLYVRWDYGFSPEEPKWFYQVKY